MSALTSRVELTVLKVIAEANRAGDKPTKMAIGEECEARGVSMSKAYSTTNALLERGWLTNESGGGPYQIAVTEQGKQHID